MKIFIMTCIFQMIFKSTYTRNSLLNESIEGLHMVHCYSKQV